ncbi:YajG family lipoprotein [Serratia liquefaciens]|uniref:hypothetical protein n=1 Tax=Serratia liquefaciens TaxID=614 RepID=UPI00384BFC1F
MKKIAFVAAIVFLSGCATQAVLPNQAKLAPQERIFKYQSPLADGAKLIIVRDSGFLGGGAFLAYMLTASVPQLLIQESA